MDAQAVVIDEEECPLLGDAVVMGAVDYKGRPVLRSASGAWRSAVFMLGAEVAERFVYHGIHTNLITYLTGPLPHSVASAAEIVNLWSGVSMILTLLGAFLADSFLGRYRTIILASAIYVFKHGLGLLTLSAMLPTTNSSAPKLQIVLFFISLYLIGIGQGGHKPCAQAFGADQFDDRDRQEAKSKSSFFNWWFFGVCAGAFVSMLLVTYAQDNLSWPFGFGVLFVVMLIAFLVFLCGTRSYRYALLKPSATTTPFLRIENAKAILNIVPIWMTIFAYAIVYAQETTFFTKQGATLDRSITPNFTIPAAALASFVPLSVMVFLSAYDLVFVPTARSFTGVRSGITTLQRIGTGLVFSGVSMAVATVVERKRLRVAEEYGVVDRPDHVTLPMRFWWLVPQYLLLGVAHVFAMVGLQEFFYDQVPTDLKSIGIALCTSVFGIGSISSSVLVSAIDVATAGADGSSSWFSNNLNKAHLDYFYLLLFGLSVVAFLAFLFLSRFHVSRN